MEGVHSVGGKKKGKVPFISTTKQEKQQAFDSRLGKKTGKNEKSE